MVSAVAVIARQEDSTDTGDPDGQDKQLIFQMVEMIAGDGWLVTCWHPCRIQSGPGQWQPDSPILRESFLCYI